MSKKNDLSKLVYNPDNVLIEELDIMEHYGVTKDDMSLVTKEDFRYSVGKVVGVGSNMKDLLGKTVYHVKNNGFFITVPGNDLTNVLCQIDGRPSSGVILSVIN